LRKTVHPYRIKIRHSFIIKNSPGRKVKGKRNGVMDWSNGGLLDWCRNGGATTSIVPGETFEQKEIRLHR